MFFEYQISVCIGNVPDISGPNNYLQIKYSTFLFVKEGVCVCYHCEMKLYGSKPFGKYSKGGLGPFDLF